MAGARSDAISSSIPKLTFFSWKKSCVWIPGFSEEACQRLSDSYRLNFPLWPCSCCDCESSGTVEYTRWLPAFVFKLRRGIYWTHLQICSVTIPCSCCVSSYAGGICPMADSVFLNCCRGVLFRCVLSRYLHSFYLISAFLCSFLRCLLQPAIDLTQLSS